MTEFEYKPCILENYPDFSDLPWGKPLSDWASDTPHIEEIQHGISRHPIVFVNYGKALYAVKEMPDNTAQKEYKLLTHMFKHQLQCVNPIGYASVQRNSNHSSILFTRYLDASVPYRNLYLSKAVDEYQNLLLDAIAGLLVQLHTAGFFWGDCSLSNVLFRHDAGALQAYLVDAETAEFHLPPLSPMLRFHDLEIMQDNITSELTDLEAMHDLPFEYPIQETGFYIQQRYRGLWEEITREEVFGKDDLYRVQERVRALNSLGFSVKDIELKNTDHGNTLKLRIFVSDRSFHRNQLMTLTGLNAEERQAQQIINEIQELKANMSQTSSPDISLEAVAYHWLINIFEPIANKLLSHFKDASHGVMQGDVIELYCHVLEHKWYLSERAHRDVGHQVAVEDYINNFG